MLVRALSRSLFVLAGLVLGVVVVEIALWFVDLHPDERDSKGAYRRMHYIYTETGLGKCYPSDPLEYLPYDLRSEAGMAALGAIIGDVADVPDSWPVEQMVSHLRENAPYCNNIELALLNGGPSPERPRQILLIGDSFTFGEGLRLEDSIGYVMAEHYAQANFPNMAWPGASIDTIYDVAKVPANVDTVLYFYNINDIAKTDALLLRRDLLHDSIDEAMRKGEDLAGVDAPPYCSYSRLCWMLQLRRWEMERSQASIDYYRDLYFGAENDPPRRQTFEKIAAMKEILEQRSTRFVVIMFPLYYKAPFSDYPFRDIHALVQTELGRRGVEFIDLAPAFDDYFSWYQFTAHPLDRHPSAEAIEVAVSYLAEHLRLE